MPEYAALIHFRNATSEEGGDAPVPTADEMNEAFLRMERSGLCKVLN